MADRPGHIELERALDSIRVGRRHRTDLGDLEGLVASIRREGLLQPVTVTPDGVLVCGLRRLVALRAIGVKTANVWVRSGITGRLGELLAEQDENTLHKPLSQTEAAALYRELKGLLEEDATRRQEATRFAAGGENPWSHGAATVAAPSAGPAGAGDTRAQAARIVTGRDSHTTLDRVGELQRLAADTAQPAAVRDRAALELAGIDAGASVTAAHLRTRTAMSLAELDRLAADPGMPDRVRSRAARDAAQLRDADPERRAADLERLAAQALARVRAEAKHGRRPPPAPAAAKPPMSVRAFVLTWDDLEGWWERADPSLVGPALTEVQWRRFQATVAGTVGFAQAAGNARHKEATADGAHGGAPAV